MAGGYQLLMTRAKVTVTRPDDEDYSVPTATVSVRDGVAKYSANGQETTAAVASVTKDRRTATVTMTDGSVWTVARQGCGCGGGR